MRIILEKICCPRCNCDSSNIIYKGKDFLHNIPGEFFASECNNCKFRYQNPRPIVDHINELYPKDYLPHSRIVTEAEENKMSQGKKKYLKQKYGYSHLQMTNDSNLNWKDLPIFNFIKRRSNIVNLIPDYVNEGKLLEIGCGSGGRLNTLRSLGWKNLYGVELVPEAAEKAKAEGFSVECGAIEDEIEKYPDNFFDVIISSMVFEHFINPFIVFKKVVDKLKPGGQFLFSTVVRNSLDAKLYGVFWGGFDFPRHMVYFKKSDIIEILSNDFNKIKISHQNAPIDFERSATWYENNKGRNILNSIVLSIAKSKMANIFGLLLAFAKVTTRVSLVCRKIN